MSLLTRSLTIKSLSGTSVSHTDQTTTDRVSPEIEIIDSNSASATTSGIQSSDSVTTGSPLFAYAAGLIVLLIAVGFLLTRDNASETAQTQQPDTTLVNNTVENPSSGSGSETGQDGLVDERKATFTESDLGLSLIVIENSQFIYEVDLLTGRRTSWAPPDLLSDADPLIVGDEVVVISQSGAWIGKPFTYSWRFLTEADQVLPSSNIGRMWLQTNVGETDRNASSTYQWTEVDSVGREYRTVLSDLPVEGLSPEVTSGPEGGILRLTDSELSPWQVLSKTGTAIARGLNDIVVWECDNTDDCRRVWYDPRTSRPKNGFYPDLAENVDVEFGSLLSADGRFVASRSGADQADVTISSVANGREIENSCVWNEPIVWSNGSDVLACATGAGAELIRTDTGESLGLVIGSDAKWARMAFMPTARIVQSQ